MFSILLFLVAAVSGPAPGALGALEIRSTPGAEVLWEGVSLGTIDPGGSLVVEQVPEGAYNVGLRKSGFGERSARVEIEAGATVRLELLLRRLTPPKSAPDPAPEPARPIEEPPALPQPAQTPQPSVTEAVVDRRSTTASASLAHETAIPTEPGERTARSALAPSLFAVLAVAGGLGLYFGRLRRQPPPQLPAGRRPPSFPREEKAVSEAEDDTGFIETLKQQEQNLGDQESGGWKREPDIIEAEYIEVFEAQEE